MERIAQTETIRQDTASHIALKKRAGLGALGRWAAGGTMTTQSDDELQAEAGHKMLAAHREGIIWFLQSRLQEAGSLQATMMDIRIQREVERSKSVLYKVKGASIPYESGDFASEGTGRKAVAGEGQVQELSQEQLQLFAQENQDMLKHYEDTLSQVRQVLPSSLMTPLL